MRERPPEAAKLEAVERLANRAALGLPSYELAEEVAREVIALLDTDGCMLLRIEGDETVMVVGIAGPGHDMFTRGTRFKLAGMLTGEIQRTGHAVYEQRYEDRGGDTARRVGAIGYQTVIGAPVWVGGRLWGSIMTGTSEEGRLEPGSEHDLEVFAGLCASAVAQAENLERLEAQAAEQSALLAVSRQVLEQADDSAVRLTIAREAAVLLGLERGALLRLAGDGSLEPVAAWPADVSDGFDRDDVAALVLDRREVVSVGDPDRHAGSDPRQALGCPLGWGAPIEYEGRLWGALVTAGPIGSPVPNDAARRLARFAELSSAAIAWAETRAALNAQLIETQQFEALVELSDDFIAIAALDGQCIYLNSGGRRLVGVDSLDEARAYKIRDFLTPEEAERSATERIPKVTRGGSWQGEAALQHMKTGAEIPVSVNSFLVSHPITGDPIALATVQRDLRERKRAEEQLRERAEEVEQLAAARRFLLVEALRAEERMRRQIGDALHDDVLQELYAARQDLEEVNGEQEALHRARVSVTAAGRQLRDAVRDLHPAVSWTTDLEGRLRSILAQGEERAGLKARLDYAVAAPSPADDLVLALVRELVQNVVKHAQATKLEVTVHDEGESLAIEVSDDGRGMEPGRPLEALRSGHVGLASARERVEALGGSFQIESEPGTSTRVQVLVPRTGLSALAADRRILG